MSRIEEHIARVWARRLSAAVLAEVREELQSMEAELSGDSGLENVWEEICAQVQQEESYYWSGYRDVIERLLYSRVGRLDSGARLALWAATEQGWEYIDDHDEAWKDADAVPVFIDDIVNNLVPEISELAADYESSTLDRYLWGAGDEEYDEDEDEQGAYEDKPIFDTSVPAAALQDEITLPGLVWPLKAFGPSYPAANAITYGFITNR